ncbi:MAG: hypothetical protein LBQ54_05335 [Planctomycetaceae bacterium]|nr:hypothetical protein [Planctomycetaceae bacterium]
MPPAGSGRPLHPSRLTLTSFGSPSVIKSFQLEAEGNCGEAARFPATNESGSLRPKAIRPPRHASRSESREHAPAVQKPSFPGKIHSEQNRTGTNKKNFVLNAWISCCFLL